MDSDPDLARLFAGGTREQAGTTPRFLLVAGLALLVLGSAAAIVPVAVTGMLLSVMALFTAHTSPGGFGYADAA